VPRAHIRRTKIVATLGPAWEQPDQMAQLLEAGVNVVRVNASHGTPEIRERWIADLHQVLADRSTRGSAAILLDLQGPRIRVGRLAEPVELTPGGEVVFAPEEVASGGEIPTTYDRLSADVGAGARILLDDGLIAVTVEAVDGHRVIGRVQYGGLLRSNKGINLPGIEVSAPAVSAKDREDVAHGVALGVDLVAVSFVRRPEDIEEVRALVPPTMRLIAKIEKDTALKNLRPIIRAADALMVARGDLGVELPFEEVPLAQKRLIRESNLHGKPVITATQMLESMISAPRPTRAEASDVANAILDGTDAVMLSAETAVGRYPLEAVQAMDRIARELERHRRGRSIAFDMAVGRRSHEIDRLRRGGEEAGSQMTRTEDAIGVAVCAAAELLHAPLIVCFTASGFTARTVASYRPPVPIVAITHDAGTFRQLSMVWGVIPLLTERVPTYEAVLEVARRRLLDMEYIETGDRLVFTAGVPFNQPGTTNLLKIETV
jgi:pyruvate kinase